MKDKWVLYDRGNDSFVMYLLNGNIRFFDSEDDASDDCYGNEEVIKLTDLPKSKQEELINQGVSSKRPLQNN